MKKQYTLFFLLIFIAVAAAYIFHTVSTDTDFRSPVYAVEEVLEKGNILITSRFIEGPFYFSPEMEEEKENHLPLKILQPDNHTEKRILHHGESVVDLKYIKEFVGTPENDFPKTVYYSFDIISAIDTTIYLLLRSSNRVNVWLNNQHQFSSRDLYKHFEAGFSDCIALNIPKGESEVLIEQLYLLNEALFEGTLCTREEFLKVHEKKFTGIIGTTIGESDTFHLLENHPKDLNASLSLSIYDITGKRVLEKELGEEEFDIDVSGLPDKANYLCVLSNDEIELRQPVFKGNPDDIWSLLSRKVVGQQKEDEMHAYIHRIDTLLKHESRQWDWWWQFKIAPVLYEADLCLQEITLQERLNRTAGICFDSYISELDNCFQHYLTVLPDSVQTDQPLPLVVIIRPYIRNHHHFLTSPQIARQWALTHAKVLANQYKYIVMMPEARMYGYEEVVPMAEAELLHSIKDIKKKYPVDEDRIYLHGNCSGGYRCFSIVAKHPELFAACALYSPVNPLVETGVAEWVKNQHPENILSYINHIPVFIQYDELDMHNPYLTFKKVVDRVKKENEMAEIVSENYSGIYYNILLAGENAFRFFAGKKRGSSGHTVTPFKNDCIIADVFSKPYLFVYTESDQSPSYQQFVEDVKATYKETFFGNIPLVTENELTLKDRETKNLILLGHSFTDERLESFVQNAGIVVENGKLFIDGELEGKNCGFQIIQKDPDNENQYVLIMSATNKMKYREMNKHPWKDGLTAFALY